MDLNSYCGGFIDADGCIGVYRNKVKAARNGIQHLAQVSAVGVVREPLDLLQQRWGGCIVFCKAKKSQHSDFYRWCLKDKKGVRQCLDDLDGHLLVKHEQRTQALRFLDLGRDATGKDYHNLWHPMPEEVWEQRDRIAREFTELNRRGPVPA